MAKMHRIQTELPAWLEKSGQHARAMPLLKNLQLLMKQRKWRELDKAADELLALMQETPRTNPSGSAQAAPLPVKIQRIQKELPAWIGSDAGRQRQASGLMKQLQESLSATDLKQAERTADMLLQMIGTSGS